MLDIALAAGLYLTQFTVPLAEQKILRTWGSVWNADTFFPNSVKSDGRLQLESFNRLQR